MEYDCSGIICKNIQQILNEPLNQTNRRNNYDDSLWCTNATVILT